MGTFLAALTFIGALIALLFALFTAKKVLKASEGTDKMKKISGAIKSGANAYLKRQYVIVSVFFAVMFVVLLVMAISGLLTVYVPFAFITGGFFSALSGFIGMKIATASGFLMAIFMSNSGGAWDNAKKYIESGEHGGKGSNQHKAAVVGDTVGDPFKDTSGPSINILIKLLSMVSIVFAGLIVNFHLF